jgi:hypothetical protein
MAVMASIWTIPAILGAVLAFNAVITKFPSWSLKQADYQWK